MIGSTRNGRGAALSRHFPAIVVVSLILALTAGDGLASKHSRVSGGKKSSRTLRSRGKSGAKASKGKRGRGREVASRGGRRRRGRHWRGASSYDVADATPTPRVSGIPPERATEIQNALIKRGYLDGPPTGQWDDNTAEAMKQFQEDNRLPVTGQPTALALKRLGVSKRPQDGYAVPVTSVAAQDPPKGNEQEKPKKPPQL